MNNLKICLVNPRSEGRGRIIPSGIRMLGEVAIKNNPQRQVRIFDSNFHENQNEMFEEINKFKPDIFGVSVFTDTLGESRKVLNSAKAPLKIAGGPYATMSPQDLIGQCDYIFLGEAELSFISFLNIIEETGSEIINIKFDSIQGLFSKENSNVRANVADDFSFDLDLFPSQGWKFVTDYLDKIRVSPMWHLKPNLINILSSRGCKNNCVFCLSSCMHGKTPRFRSVENIEEEIKCVQFLRNKKGLPQLESVIFDDSDIFFRDRKSLERLFLLMKKYKLTYSAFTSINNFSENLIKLGVTTGLKSLFFGIETHEGNRKYIGKGKKFSDKKAAEVLEICRKNGIFTCLGYIIGFPWESLEDMKKTIECMNKLPGDYPGVGVLDLHPGTAIWRYKEKHFEEYLKKYGEKDVNASSLPHPTINKDQLDRLVREGYFNAYKNPKRISSLNSIRDSFDRECANKVIIKKMELAQKIS